MSRYLVLCSLFWVFGAVAIAQDQRVDSVRSVGDYVDSVRQANHGPAYKKVKKFLPISVTLQQEEELGLDEKDLGEYAGLRFKNNFATIELDQELGGIPPWDYPPAEKDAVHGIVSFTVWTVGTNYPVAYHISLMAGTMGPDRALTVLDRYTDAALGYCSKKQLVAIVKQTIDSMMEDFAIDFFKARGEL